MPTHIPPNSHAPASHAPQSLAGVRVLDLSRILAGPWCTQTLGDLGADIIKIERPGLGDDTRRWGPPFIEPENAASAQGEAAYFLCANRNKRSLTCDISTTAGQTLIRDLVLQCDVFIENYKVGDMARYGLDYATLAKLNPRLVYCSITGFGQTGPHHQRAGYDYAIQAMGGLMSITGETDAAGGTPQKVGVAVVDLFTGMYASVAILAALRHAEATGLGQYIDMALLDTQIAMLANVGANYHLSGQVPQRLGNAHANIAPYQVFEVAPLADGSRDFIVLAVGNDTQFAKLCAACDLAALALDARFDSNAARITHRAELAALLQVPLRTQDKNTWLQRFAAAQVPASAINHLGEVFADPHIEAHQMVDSWQHPERAALPLTASPLHLSRTPVKSAAQGGSPPPLLGQHSADILRALLSLDERKIAQLQSDGVI